MEPILAMAGLLALFSATHIGLATRAIRAGLVARLGERGFTVLFFLVAAATFGAAVHGYTRLRGTGPAGLGLGEVPLLGPALGLLVGAGVVLMAASFATYPSSPMSPAGSARSPRGLERISRHPFFAGVVIFGSAHALLASQAVGMVLFAGLALHAGLGLWHQDRKLLRRLGEPYRAFLAETSAVPFAAIAAGRQRLVLGELPPLALAAGVAIAFALSAVHAHIFDYGGLYVIGATVGGAGSILAAEWRAIPKRLTPAASG